VIGAATLAVLSDIHGNVWALDAMLDDIARRGLDVVVNLGDSLAGPLAPAEVADRLIARGIPSVRGNDDRALLAAPAAPSATYDYVIPRLTPRHLDWLRALPPTLVVGDDVLLSHGTPNADDVYLLEEVREGAVALRPPDAIRADLAAVRQPVVLCGHSHVPHAVAVLGGPLVVNPGSVGLPAYTADAPRPHAMEAGTPHARYALLSRAGDADAWAVAHIAVPYPWEVAAAAARANGRPEWARWLESGRGP